MALNKHEYTEIFFKRVISLSKSKEELKEFDLKCLVIGLSSIVRLNYDELRHQVQK
jgi:hypothetical protein